MTAWSQAFVPYGNGRKAPVGGLADAALLEGLARYKRQVARRYRVLEPNEIERALPKGQLWLSPKLDGELWFMVRREGDLALCAHNGRVLHGIPLLAELAPILAAAPDFVVAGELVAPIYEGRPRSPHVATAFGDERHAGALAFHPFDLVEAAGADAQATPYAERLARLRGWFGEERVMTTVVGDAAQAASYYREWVVAGKHEGLVARSEQNITFKIKPHLTLDAVVVAYGERLVGEHRQLRELCVALLRDDGTFQVLGTVGTGFSEDDRAAWLERLGGMAATGSARHRR
jgi:ATP-dependent DNA ligase